MDIIVIKEYKNIIMFTQAYKKVKENPVILAAVASVAIAILATILTSSFTTKKHVDQISVQQEQPTTGSSQFSESFARFLN